MNREELSHQYGLALGRNHTSRGNIQMKAPWTEGNMTKHPVLDVDTTTKKKGYGLNISITRNEKVMLLWIAVCLFAGGFITQF